MYVDGSVSPSVAGVSCGTAEDRPCASLADALSGGNGLTPDTAEPVTAVDYEVSPLCLPSGTHSLSLCASSSRCASGSFPTGCVWHLGERGLCVQ